MTARDEGYSTGRAIARIGTGRAIESARAACFKCEA